MSGATSKQMHQIAVLLFQLLRLRVCDVTSLDCAHGSLVHPFSHRPELNSVLHRVYKWKTSLEPGRVYKMPGDIRDELHVAVLYLSLCDVSVRAPAEDVLRATDATPSVDLALGHCGRRMEMNVCGQQLKSSVLHPLEFPTRGSKRAGPSESFSLARAALPVS